MSVVLITGPEKAGKTTLARAVQAAFPAIGYRHWGPVASHAEYRNALLEDAARPEPIIWDRGWPDEWVYGTLLGQPRPLAADPWLGEWLYGRVLAAGGTPIMLLGPSVATLRERRDATDLPVDPADEVRLYHEYGKRFGYRLLLGANPVSLGTIILQQAYQTQVAALARPPIWVGPQFARVAVVGENRNLRDKSLVPFGSPMTTRYGRALGDAAMRCAWTNTDCDPAWLAPVPLRIACGKTAAAWMAVNGVPAQLVLPHPAHLYRWRQAHSKFDIGQTEATLLRCVTRELNHLEVIA